MSNVQSPPPPPPGNPSPGTTSPAKKKSGALKWILIGCLGILLIALILFGACSIFVAKKAQDFAGEVSENPAMAAAEMVVRLNPEIELVSKDEANQTLTIRNKETGEEITLDLDEVEQGRFSWESEGKTVTIDGSAATEGGAGGVITVEDETGGEQLSMGTGTADEIPDWVPTYPGAKFEAPFMMTSGDELQGTLSFETGDSLIDVESFYVEKLEASGFEVEKSTFSSGEMQTTMLSAAQGGRSVLVNITVEGGARTRVGINFGQSAE
jgi:archaellum component FlaG (FlaF/FlaG flagellin family)